VVADRIRSAIENGDYPPGSQLPPEPDLAEQQRVSRPTLRESLRLLESEGLVVRRPRVGTVVTGRPVARNALQRNYGIQEMLADSGRDYGVRDAEIKFADAPAEVATALGISVGAPTGVLERTIISGGRPVMLSVDHVAYSIIERARSSLGPKVAWYDWLHGSCDIDVSYGVASVSAVSAGPDALARLELPDGSPLFRVEQVDYTSADVPVLYSVELHAPDAFDITVVRSGPYD
jgi:DNA-binding GntR family transcriptional regulator